MKTPKLELVKKFGNYLSPDDPGEMGGRAKRRSVSEGEASILMEAARDLNVLEIGTGLGVSTRAIAKYAKSVISVDKDPWAHQFEFPDNVELATELPEGHFDLAFIDGDHKYESVLADIAAVDADVLIIHDCYLEGVSKAIDHSHLTLLNRWNTSCDMRAYRK